MTILAISLYKLYRPKWAKNGLKWPYFGQKCFKWPKNWSYDAFMMFLSISKISKIFAYIGQIFGQKTLYEVGDIIWCNFWDFACKSLKYGQNGPKMRFLPLFSKTAPTIFLKIGQNLYNYAFKLCSKNYPKITIFCEIMA